MAVVYITSDYGTLNRVNGILNYANAEGVMRKVFLHNLDTMVISGKATITGEALRLLMEYQVNTIFANPNGKYNGKLVFAGNSTVALRKKQYAICENKETALKIAKQFVSAKIANEICFVQRINRKDYDKEGAKQVAETLKKLLEKSKNTLTLEELRGFEGMAAKLYFSVFRYNIQPEWAEFTKRSSHPPLSNVNAALGFLYMLLMYRVEVALEAAGLDTGLGFLHSLGQRADSLVFDLIEEFRTPVADTLCCALFNHKMLSKDDFREEQIGTKEVTDESQNQKNAVFLTKQGIDTVIMAFEAKMGRTIKYDERNLTYNEIIIRQAELLKDVIAGTAKEYRGYLQK